jgi:hypothetical protein
MGAMLLAGAKEKVGEIATGNKGKLDNEKGEQSITRVGAGYNKDNKNANGTQSYSDAQAAMQLFAGNRINQQRTDAEKNAPPPPKEPPKHPSSGEAKRENNERPQNPRPSQGGRSGPPMGGRGNNISRGNPPPPPRTHRPPTKRK